MRQSWCNASCGRKAGSLLLAVLLGACGGSAGDRGLLETGAGSPSPVEAEPNGGASEGTGGSPAAEVPSEPALAPSADTPPPELAPDGPDCSTDGVVGADIEARTQADVAALAGCVTFTGSLRIHGLEALDLTPLASLRSVAGTLMVGAVEVSPEGTRVLSALRSLRGLEGLRDVGTLVLADLDVDLQPLSNLTSVASLVLSNLPGVVNLRAFSNTTVWRELSVETLPDLQSLAGVRVGPELENLSAWYVPRLESLAGIEGLARLRSLWLMDTPALSRLGLSESLTELSDAWLTGPSQLTTLAELSRFTTLADLRVSDQANLAELGAGDAAGGSLRLLSVERCPLLTTLAPAGGLSNVEEVYVIDCDGVTQLDGLAASPVLQLLHVYENDALLRLPAFTQTASSMRALRIVNNAALVEGPRLPNLNVLYQFDSLNYQAAELMISGNPVLTSIGDFSQLASTSMLIISDNPRLEAAVLPSLQALTWLRVSNNAELSQLELNLQGNLRYVELENNPLLDTVTLGAPTNSLSMLTLRNNPGLAPAVRQQLLDLTLETTSLTLD